MPLFDVSSVTTTDYDNLTRITIGEGDGNDGVNGQGGSPDTVAGGQGIDTVIGENVDEAFNVFVDWCDDI